MMKRLCALVGGTGKRHLASFASFAATAVLADCDVDADLHLILKPVLEIELNTAGTRQLLAGQCQLENINCADSKQCVM